LCEAADRIFLDEAGDLTLKVKAKDCNCAGQLYGSTMTTKDTSVASLAQFSGKNQPEPAEVLSAEGAHLTVTTRLRTEHSLRLNSPFQRTCRKVRSLPKVSAACINNISDFVSQLNSGGGNNSSEENSSAEYSGTSLRISSTGRPVAKSTGQDNTDAENPHTPGMEKPFAWSAEQSSSWCSWWSPSDSLWSWRAILAFVVNCCTHKFFNKNFDGHRAKIRHQIRIVGHGLVGPGRQWSSGRVLRRVSCERHLDLQCA